MLKPQDRSEMIDWVKELLGHDKAARWWVTPNPMLGNIPPWGMTMTERQEQKLYNFIYDAYHAGGHLQVPAEGKSE